MTTSNQNREVYVHTIALVVRVTKLNPKWKFAVLCFHFTFCFHRSC